MRIVLLGAPGSGKKTLTSLLVEKYGIPPVYTGQLQKEAQERMVKEADDEDRPHPPEEMVLDLIRDRLMMPDARDGFVLEGFPRNIIQAITLDEVLAEMGMPVELALLLDLETDALMERLVGRRTCSACGALYNIYSHPSAVDDICDLCGGRLRHRADDTEETVSGRLHVYDHFAANLIKHYTRQGKLKRVDGMGTVEEVFARASAVIDSHDPAQLVAQASTEEAKPRGPEPATAEATSESTLTLDHSEPVAAAKKVMKKKTLKKSATKKSVAKKKAATPAKKSASSVRSTGSVKKSVVNKKSTKKKAVTKKKATPAKKAVKKAIAQKKASQGKVVAKKTAVKKGPVKKPLVKKASGKKVALKKSIAKKAGAKPAAAKKKVIAKKKVVKKQPAKPARANRKKARVSKRSGK